jgi:hypothetical protein
MVSFFNNTHGLSFHFYPYNVKLGHYTTLNPKPFSRHEGMVIKILIAIEAWQLHFFFNHHLHVATKRLSIATITWRLNSITI